MKNEAWRSEKNGSSLKFLIRQWDSWLDDIYLKYIIIKKWLFLSWRNMSRVIACQYLCSRSEGRQMGIVLFCSGGLAPLPLVLHPSDQIAAVHASANLPGNRWLHTDGWNWFLNSFSPRGEMRRGCCENKKEMLTVFLLERWDKEKHFTNLYKIAKREEFWARARAGGRREQLAGRQVEREGI